MTISNFAGFLNDALQQWKRAVKCSYAKTAKTLLLFALCLLRTFENTKNEELKVKEMRCEMKSCLRWRKVCILSVDSRMIVRNCYLCSRKRTTSDLTLFASAGRR